MIYLAYHASTEYRRELVAVLLKNALSTAWERAA
jgi:CO/xanthine dehydrogenase FAD-binding subunit